MDGGWSQQHAGVSLERSCLDKRMCCHWGGRGSGGGGRGRRLSPCLPLSSLFTRPSEEVKVKEGGLAVCFFASQQPPRWPSGKASTSRAEGPGFESRLRRDFFGVESYQ